MYSISFTEKQKNNFTNCLFCDFLQIVLNRSRMMHAKSRNYFLSLGYETYVGCQSLFVCKHCLDLLTLFPTDTKISHGCLNLRIAKLKGLEPSDVKLFCISIK